MLVSRSLKPPLIFLLTVFVSISSPSAWPQKRPAPAASRWSKRPPATLIRSATSLCFCMHFCSKCPREAIFITIFPARSMRKALLPMPCRTACALIATALSFTQPPCDPAANKPPASVALQDPTLYGHLLDAFSMRQFVPGAESGHDHFFATFGKFGAATNGHTAEMLAEARSRAAAGHLQYMELMFNPDGGAAARLGASLGWNDDLSKLRDQLLSGGLPQDRRRRQQISGRYRKERAGRTALRRASGRSWLQR